MSSTLSGDLKALRKALGNGRPPRRITQKPFDHDDAHLRAFVRLQPDAKPDGGHLVSYAHDLQYEQVVQKDLLDYVLPFCLRVWREDLTGRDRSHGGFVEHLYPVLVRIATDVLTEQDSAAVASFMRAGILEELDAQSGLSYTGSRARPYRWIGALASHGVLFADVEKVWTAWWSQPTIGRAVASVQYLSCLVYDDEDNPVFAPWTRDAGGGPPVVWHFAGHLYYQRWLPENVSFLRGALNPETVAGTLAQSVDRLSGRPEQPVAARVLADARDRRSVLRRRCVELPQILERQQDPGDLFAWRQ
jgi:hypothetical protein